MDIKKLPKPWTIRQYKFALAYLESPIGTEAAIKAGYSKKAAGVTSHRMLNDANFSHVQDFIAKKAQKAIDQYERSAEKTLRELAYLAHSNMLDYISIGADGLPYVDAQKTTREQWAAVSKIKIKEMPPFKTVENGEEVVREVLTVELSLWEKPKALEILGRYQKLEKALQVNVNHTGKVTYDLPEFARRMAFVLAKAAKMSDTPVKGVQDGNNLQKGDPHGQTV